MTPTVVAVMGSCTSRDNFNSRFNPDYKRWFSCELATNQTSPIALMSPPVDEPFEPVDPMSDYNVWNVASDLSREFLTRVVELQPDYVVVDFFADVHLGVIRLDDGRYLTDNRWKLHHTDLYARLRDEDAFTRLKLLEDTEDYLAVWREAVGRFAAYLREHCPGTTVVLHRGFNTDRIVVPSRLRAVSLQRTQRVRPFDVERGNQLWAVLDDYCVETFGWESIDLRGEPWTCFKEHPWGPFFVHFTMDYYHRFLAELHKLHLRRTGTDDDALLRLEQVEQAARESEHLRLAASEAVVADQEERLRAQRRRIEELEGLGLLRSARFAVGQRLRARSRTQKKENR